METRLDNVDFVRCVSCRRLYEPAQPGASPRDGDGCPNCGEARWLAERVPVEESQAVESAQDFSQRAARKFR